MFVCNVVVYSEVKQGEACRVCLVQANFVFNFSGSDHKGILVGLGTNINIEVWIMKTGGWFSE
jgi:hypothetical protein